MNNLLLSLSLSFFVAWLLAIPIIKILKKQKVGQNILEYVDLHNAKQGTPTMGGIIFLSAMCVVGLLMIGKDSFLSTLTMLVGLGYGLIGFLDDYIKIKFKRNLGLRAYQKIIGQGGLAIIIGFICYFNRLIPTSLILPFGLGEWEVGIWIIPIVIFIFLAVTNAVNLTDGLDGLAGGVSVVYLIGFGCILSSLSGYLYSEGASDELINEYNNLLVVNGALVGGVLGFLLFNTYPAKIFMGDVGSLAIGAVIACLACFTGLIFYIPLLGIMFVLSTVSVILQVLHYKRTKKRIFLMAPLHHHFEKKGVNESKIVSIYIITTIIVCATTIALGI